MAQVLLIQAPLFQQLLAPLIQAFAALASLVTNKLRGKQYKKHLKQVHITCTSDICFAIDKYINYDTNV